MSAAIDEEKSVTESTMRAMRAEWQGQALNEAEEIALGMFGRETEVGQMLLARLTLLRAQLKRRPI